MPVVSIPELYAIYLAHPSVTTDTRNIAAGDIFFALKGPNFNGNQFAAQALQQGAAYVVVDEDPPETDPRILRVEDSLKTLQDLALHHRQQLHIPVLAITGSNGKTTTKELIHAVLSTRFNTSTTQGNLNNHIGIPLTLLRIPTTAEMAVVEMGANHQQEIAAYCRYTLPTHGLITNCGKAHLEGFGGEEGVRKGKGELFDFLRSAGGVAFASADFAYFDDMTIGLAEVHRYGTLAGEVTGSVVSSEPFLVVSIDQGFDVSFEIHTQLVGAYNIHNILAAVAVGRHFGVPRADIAHAIAQYTPTNSRSQLLEKDGNRIILDAYNANPTSMAAAIENFARLDVQNKILFIGGMMELGGESLEEHRQIVALIGRYPWKEVLLVGGDFGRIQHPYRYFNHSGEAAAWWQQHQSTGNYLLVKGSRSMQMEKILQPATQ